MPKSSIPHAEVVTRYSSGQSAVVATGCSDSQNVISRSHPAGVHKGIQQGFVLSSFAQVLDVVAFCMDAVCAQSTINAD